MYINNTDILIIILNWNGWSDTKQCLDSILKLEGVNYTTLVIDNGSETDCIDIENYGLSNYLNFYSYTKDNINKQLPRPQLNSLTLIENGENFGFAKANNIGIKFAELTDFEYIYLLNNDTIVEPDSLSKLAECLIDSVYSAVVPQIRYYDTPEIIWCCGGEIKNFYEYYHYKNETISVVPNKKLIDITFATGCALLFKRSEIKKLTERFFFGEEDFELALRMKQQKMKMACILDSVIYHKENASINKSTQFLNKIYIHKLNRLINIKYHAPFRWPMIIIYRSFKFFLLLLLIERKGIFKALKYALKLGYQAFTLSEVNKMMFLNLLKLNLN
ncbi:glycosyltransferase family 2 protein [Mucilaginibacter sp.]